MLFYQYLKFEQPLIYSIYADLITLVGKHFHMAEQHPELYYFFLGGLFSSILVFILLLIRKKASLHMVGIVALTFFVIGLSQYVEIPMLYTISTLILLIGFVASSRLVMKAHTFTELILGFICGALPQIIFWPLWL